MYTAFSSDGRGDPDFTNNRTKFWIELSLTKYARSKLNNKYFVAFAETNEGFKAYVLIYYNTFQSEGEYIHEDCLYEGMATYIDMLRMTINN